MENLEGNWVNLLCIVFKKTKQNSFFFFFLAVHAATLVANHCAAQHSSEPLPKPAWSLQKNNVVHWEKSFGAVLVVFSNTKMSTSSAQNCSYGSIRAGLFSNRHCLGIKWFHLPLCSSLEKLGSVTFCFCLGFFLFPILTCFFMLKRQWLVTATSN